MDNYLNLNSFNSFSFREPKQKTLFADDVYNKQIEVLNIEVLNKNLETQELKTTSSTLERKEK